MNYCNFKRWLNLPANLPISADCDGDGDSKYYPCNFKPHRTKATEAVKTTTTNLCNSLKNALLDFVWFLTSNFVDSFVISIDYRKGDQIFDCFINKGFSRNALKTRKCFCYLIQCASYWCSICTFCHFNAFRLSWWKMPSTSKICGRFSTNMITNIIFKLDETTRWRQKWTLCYSTVITTTKQRTALHQTLEKASFAIQSQKWGQ